MFGNGQSKLYLYVVMVKVERNMVHIDSVCVCV